MTISNRPKIRIKITLRFQKKHLTTLCLGLTSSDTYGMMISSEGSFTLKILNDSPINLTDEDWQQFNKKYKKFVQRLQENNILTTGSIQKMFLGLMAEYNLSNKIGLYKASNNNLTQWSRITLVNNSLNETP